MICGLYCRRNILMGYYTTTSFWLWAFVYAVQDCMSTSCKSLIYLLYCMPVMMYMCMSEWKFKANCRQCTSIHYCKSVRFLVVSFYKIKIQRPIDRNHTSIVELHIPAADEVTSTNTSTIPIHHACSGNSMHGWHTGAQHACFIIQLYSSAIAEATGY